MWGTSQCLISKRSDTTDDSTRRRNWGIRERRRLRVYVFRVSKDKKEYSMKEGLLLRGFCTRRDPRKIWKGAQCLEGELNWKRHSGSNRVENEVETSQMEFIPGNEMMDYMSLRWNHPPIGIYWAGLLCLARRNPSFRSFFFNWRCWPWWPPKA